MNANELNPKQFLKISRVIYFSLWSGITAFLVTVLFISGNKISFSIDLSDPLLISNVVLACIILPAGNWFAKTTFKKIEQNELLIYKLTKYQSGQLIRLATCEGIGILSIVSLFLSANLFFMLFLLIPLFIMLLYYPTPVKIGLEIGLTQNEIDMFTE